MDRKLLQALVALSLLTSGAILAVSLVGANRSAETLSESLITNTIAQTDSELGGFFESVDGVLRIAKSWGDEGILDASDVERMNQLFIPLLSEHPAITSMILASSQGEEYMLLELPGGYRNRVIDRSGARVQRRDESGALRGEEPLETAYDPRQRPWFQEAMSGALGEVQWTEPYTFFTTREPGITASMRFRPPDASRDWVVAFDVLLLDISRFTTSLEAGAHGRVSVLTSDGRVLGLPRDPRFADDAAIREAVLSPVASLALPALTASLADAGEATRPGAPFRFEAERETFWGATHPFHLSSGRSLDIVALVPESDFTGRVGELRNRILAIAALALLLSIALALLLERAVQRRLQRELQRARRVGPYTLEAELGHGGMGKVYRARHALLRRPTAVKLMRREQQDELSSRRFEKEVQLTSQLTHPNTIAIYDFGRTRDGTFYYAMEYLEGITLEDLVQRTGPLPPERVIHILRQVCGSLAEAHDAGLIHRDIKPANVMLCARGGLFDWVKVLDFGLVKHAGDASETGVDGAGEGHITGTPHYIAPEALVTPDKVDARSDLYAVGAVGYLLLTGTTVFHGRSMMETLTQHLSTPPDPPSERAPRPIPEDLEGVILACLAKDPEERPASARVLRELLGRCACAHAWTQEAARAWWETHLTLFSMPPPTAGGSLAEEPTQLAIDLGTR